MNECIIQSINDHVKEDDIFFLLGDMLFGDKTQLPYWRNRINCKTIHYNFGNHCVFIRKSQECRSLFTSCSDYLEVFLGKKLVCMSHYPMYSWNKCHHGSWCLFGHQHCTDKSERNGKTLDIGWDFRQKPLDYFEIYDIMKDKNWKPIDHHDSNTTE